MTTRITQELFERSKYGKRYPHGVIEVPQQIEGTSFFPGGHGVWMNDGRNPPFPRMGVMVLGHDFHSQSGYQRSLQQKHEDVEGPTWGPLKTLLKEVDIPLSKCFFTNVYMGLREGTKATGTFPGARDKEFVAHCKNFFLLQLAAQKPGLVLALGSNVSKFLSTLAPQLVKWKDCKSFTSRDEMDCSVVQGVQFLTTLPTYKTTVVSLTHPSFRRVNVNRRTWAGKIGNDAEVAMLRDAIANSQLRFEYRQ